MTIPNIGMPISSIADKLTYEKSVNGFALYKTTSANYCSVFNIRMDYVGIVIVSAKRYHRSAPSGTAVALEVVPSVSLEAVPKKVGFAHL